MESDKTKGKRGRPKKIVTNIATTPTEGIKRGRGRPSKVVGEENIKIKKEVIMEEPIEAYVQPTILRKKRVFKFDKRLFHAFVKKYNGDIIVMGYVFDNLMKLYMENKIKLPEIDERYYSNWCDGHSPLEPLKENELAVSESVIKGIPLQYKYPMIIDREFYSVFEHNCKRYPPFITNELIKYLMDDRNKLNIDISKCNEWCTL